MFYFMYIWAFVLCVYMQFCLDTQSVQCLDNGLATTPPMGWNSWERYRCTVDCNLNPNDCISERLIKMTSDVMASSGYLQAGYEYVVIDDCWLANRRDKDGYLQPNWTRFPSGILDLSKYVHSKGLLFGIYGNYGEKTCSGYPGIRDNLMNDAKRFAEWEVDYIKLDGCYSEVHEKEVGYPEFGVCLNSTRRPIVYSCSWPAYLQELSIEPDYEALKTFCNLWRNFVDVEDSWTVVTEIMDYFADKQDTIGRHAGPGHWNDPDMLIVGNFGLSLDQSKAQMAIWSILAAPLFISTDVLNIRPEFAEILLNRDIIAVDQDIMGIQGRRIYKKRNLEVWRRPVLPSNKGYHSYAVAFLNRRVDGVPRHLGRTLTDLGLYNPNGYIVQDLYCGLQRKCASGTIRTKINPTGVVFLKFWSIPDEENQPVNNFNVNNFNRCSEEAFFIE